MARKAFKPCKAAAKRFRVTKKGKLKRHHGFTSHLMSSRSANRRRKLRKPEVVSESHARRLRKIIGLSGIGPGKSATRALARTIAQKRAAAAQKAASAQGAVTAE